MMVIDKKFKILSKRYQKSFLISGMSLFLMLLLTGCFSEIKQSEPKAGSDPAPNIVENPGFEDEFEKYWRVSGFAGGEGSGLITSKVKRNGKRSVKLSKSNSYGYLQLSSVNTVTVEPGETYTFRFWFNSSNAQITSFLIPRLVEDNDQPNITNTVSALWVNYDYDSQSLMRNSPTTKPEDWIKRVVFYTNNTEEVQEIFLQVMMYGNPFDVYIDDITFFKGKKPGTSTPENPEFKFSEEEVKEILAEREEVTAYFTWKDNTPHFFLNGDEIWPRLYRATPRSRSDSDRGQQDPAGMYNAGVKINNVMTMRNFWVGKDKYDWKALEKSLLQTLRKNPYANIHLDLTMDPYREWLMENPESNWELKDGTKLNEASYASQKWREDGSMAIRELIRALKKQGYWKAIAGFVVWGGHDGQFWTKVIGEFASDYCEEHVDAFHNYLKNEYYTIKNLNRIWNSSYASFSEIPIPETPTGHEEFPVIMPKGLITDYRQFTEAAAFDLRETFAKVIKEEAGKKTYVMSYGMPMLNQHERFLKMAKKDGKANDVIVSMSYYPYRQPGFASGYHPEQSFGYHKTAFCQELDLRSWASNHGWYNELADMWCSSQPDIEDWKNMHRKLVGISLAQDQAYWYYDMDKQFVNDKILDEVRDVSKIADKLVHRKGVDFQPDVCLVRFGAEARYYGTWADASVGATNYWQYMLLETAGVPFDIHYLMDIIAEPELQDYKIYIFHNNTYLTEAEREWINKNLKKDGKTIIWMYDTGYATDSGLSVDAMSKLTGMKIATEKGYQRARISIGQTDRLNGAAEGYLKVPEFQGMAEALCGIFSSEGKASLGTPYICKWNYMVLPGIARYQKFWVEDGYDSALGKYIEDGKVALAVKRFSDWTSIYIGAPNSLASEMMNNIANDAGAFRCGTAAMGEVRMSGRFVSYHALRNGKYELRLPPGAKKIIKPETGEVLAEDISFYIIDTKAQDTHWFFIE